VCQHPAGVHPWADFVFSAAIKEGMYDLEFLASYLVHRMNVLHPSSPAYMPLLKSEAGKLFEPEEFLEALCRRLGMLHRGGFPDIPRASQWFIEWWRQGGGVVAGEQSSNESGSRFGWGFDFEWNVESVDHGALVQQNEKWIQNKMEERILEYLEQLKEESAGGEWRSQNQEKKLAKQIRDQSKNK